MKAEFGKSDKKKPKSIKANLWAFMVLIISCSSDVYGQLTINSPVNNQVIQRDSLSMGTIQITGYSYFPYQIVRATLTALSGSKQSTIETNFTADQLKQGFLSTSLSAPAGWYKLTLTGFSSEGIVDSVSVSRVGIGEVFLIAGNSNAMGLPNLGAKNAGSNVISFNATNKILNKDNITVAPDLPMATPSFSPIEAESALFPSGETSWYWGELGDMLSKKWNVPILFFNTAWAAADSENYRDGALGKDAYNMYVGKNWPNRQPYSNLKNALRYFHSWLGIRAILWAHGENDAHHGVSENDYFNNIKTLIDKSRQDAGYTAPWLLARSSAGEAYPKPYQPIIQAQNRMFKLKKFHAYEGPDLDTVQIPRPKHGHFENILGGIQGLTQGAQAWNRILTDSLLYTIGSTQPKYAVHTGVTPSEVRPGSTFYLPFQITGTNNTTMRFHAELLDKHNEFVDTVGVGNQSPMQITLPVTLNPGKYTIRITGSAPILPGSVSTPFYVDPLVNKNQYVNHIEARKSGQNIQISWLMAVFPQLKMMVLQKTKDGINYQDVTTMVPVNITLHSQIYTYTDSNLADNNTFYRIVIEDVNGQQSFSPIATVFKDNLLPPFIVFPNPITSQQFYIRSNTDPNILVCKLYDVLGREHSITTNDREMTGVLTVRPVSHLPSGNYILQITSNAGTSSQLILVR